TEILGEMGIPPPAGETIGDMALRLQHSALMSCNASFDGAGEALRQIVKSGHHVHMASSQESAYLTAGLIGAGLDSHVRTRFGPDLIDCAKEGLEFYSRIFAATRISAEQAVVVDDQAICLEWARQGGANVIQARIKTEQPAGPFPALHDLLELPA